MAGLATTYQGGQYVLDLLTGAWTTNVHGGDLELTFNAGLGVWQNQEIPPYTFRAVTVAQTTTGTLPRLFGAEAGSVRVRELELGATDDYATGSHPITGLWLSHPFDMGLTGREKRIIHLEVIVASKAGTTTAGSGQLDLYADGGSTPIQSVLFPLTVPTSSGSNLIRVFTRAVGAARAEFFQIGLSSASTQADLQVVQIGCYYTVAT